MEFVAWEDPQLGAFGSWVGVSHFFPGDHKGCRCFTVPAVCGGAALVAAGEPNQRSAITCPTFEGDLEPTGTAKITRFDPDTGKLIESERVKRTFKNADLLPDNVRQDAVRAINEALDELPEGWRPSTIEFERVGQFGHGAEYDSFGVLGGKPDRVLINADAFWDKSGQWNTGFSSESLKKTIWHESGHRVHGMLGTLQPERWAPVRKRAVTIIEDLAQEFDLDDPHLWGKVIENQMSYPIMQTQRFHELTGLIGAAENELISETMAYGRMGTLEPEFQPLWEAIKDAIDGSIIENI